MESENHCTCCLPSAQTNIPVFRAQEGSVRRRYSDFEWLKKELERDSKVARVPRTQGQVGAIVIVLQKSLLRRDDFCEWGGCVNDVLKNANSTAFTSLRGPALLR